MGDLAVEDDCSPPKITKNEEAVDSNTSALTFLKTADIREILGNDSCHKTTSILLENKTGVQGVMLLCKTPFPENKEILCQIAHEGHLDVITKNDIFGSYNMVIPSDLNKLQAQFIYPANEKIIAKYRFEEKFVISETAEDYQKITLPYILEYQMNLQWVYNILNKQAEADKIIYEDSDAQNGFLLANDIKWNGKDIDTLYVLAIINRHGVKSIRDLTALDIPLLENIREKSLQAINDKYGLRQDQIRVYFHYQPSFYHLHVHFVNLKYDAPASSTLSAVLLDDVVNNLRLVPDYYQKATLTFTRKKTDRLLQRFREAGRCSC